TADLIEVVIGNVAGSFVNSDINLDPKIIIENSTILSGLASILNELKQLGIEIGQGILKAPTLVANIFRINNTGSDAINNSIGRSVINPGQQWVEINNMKVEETSQIFITPNKPVAIAICEQKAGISFKVCLNAPASEEVWFSWWIVGVDGGTTLPVSSLPPPPVEEFIIIEEDSSSTPTSTLIIIEEEIVKKEASSTPESVPSPSSTPEEIPE
ncbi:MAG: hypothetical protein AAB847_01530, partial [Patescibacteria group bacterium]